VKSETGSKSESNEENPEELTSSSKGVPEKPFYKKAPFVVGIVVLLLLFSSVGYSLYPEYTAAKSLEFDVEGTGEPDPGIESIDIPVEKIFHNPSEYDTPSIEADYDVYIEGTYVGEGSLSLGIVSSEETKVDEQIVTVYYEDVGTSLAEVLRSGEFVVTIRGEARAYVLYNSIPVSQDFAAKYSF